ncbi:MAG: methyltransferase domain-containing protein [Gammaproteobacteria bacterium]|nr:methyltransferase domain-containing protein [Gammaproteobacteria bacterium]
MYVSDYQAYQKIITDSYNARSKSYSKSEWHKNAAEKLVDYFPPKEGDSVLDIATGTGAAAMYSSKLVGTKGRVLGVDLSEGMIKQAEKIRSELNCENLEFMVGDGESLNFPDNSFDRIYCASAFFWIADKPKALSNWRRMLKPGGILGFHAFPETSYVYGYVARKVLKKHGVEYLAHAPTGSKEICEALLNEAGFVDIQIKEVKDGHYLTLEEAKEAWISEAHYPIGQYPHPVTVTPKEILEDARLDYEAEMERLATKEGVWNDTTTYYVYGVK